MSSPYSNQRIAILLPFLHQGGVERKMLNLSQEFVKRGICVDLVLATRAEGPYVTQIPFGVQVVELQASSPLKALPGLVRYLRARRPQALLSCLTPANIIAVWARKILHLKDTKVVINVPLAVRVRLSTTTMRAIMRPLVYRVFYTWADIVVAVSQGVAEDLKKFGLPEAKIRVIYNPVVSSDLYKKADEPISHPWFEPGEPPVILGAGRLHRQKDFVTLIKAFALVRKQRPARLVILGEGEERSRLESLIYELGLEKEIALPGFVDNPFPYMKRAAVFVLSSVYEGFANVVAEAIALGTPVVSTDCPHGPAEILEGGEWGILVPVGNVQALAQAILEALDKPWDRDALRLRAQAFSVDVIASKYLEII